MDDVEPNERLSRFILDKRLIRPDMSVKHGSFMPPKTGKLSVYRTRGQTDQAIWEIGQEFVANPLQKSLFGRADLSTAQQAISEGLSVLAEPTPHPLHADIVGWPSDSTELRLKAVKLAGMATAVLK